MTNVACFKKKKNKITNVYQEINQIWQYKAEIAWENIRWKFERRNMNIDENYYFLVYSNFEMGDKLKFTW